MKSLFFLGLSIFCPLFWPLTSLNADISPLPTKIFTDYRQVPGVTPEDIAAIEALKAQRPSLIFANAMSTEIFTDHRGHYGGYVPLLCHWLSDLFDWSFVPKSTDWDDVLAGLARKEYAFTGDLTPTPERRQTFFMTGSVAERTIKYMFLAQTDLDAISLKRPLKLAFLKGTVTLAQVKANSTRPFATIEVDNYREAYRALIEGEADAFLDEGPAEAAFDDHGEVIAEDYFPMIYSPVAMATQDPELEPVIRVVQKALDAGIMPHLVDLYNQGEKDYQRNKFLKKLTHEELSFLETLNVSGKTVSLSAESENYPISFYNKREEEYQGIALDILAELTALTGLRFTVANAVDASWSDNLGLLESGAASLITELINSPDRANQFLWTQKPYMVDNYALLSRRETPDIKLNQILYLKVGLVENSAFEEIFKTWFPDHPSTKLYADNLEALEGLERGEVDLVMATKNLLLAMTNYMEKPGFKANYIFNYRVNTSFGFNINERILVSIFDKALPLIDTSGVSKNWTSRTFDYRAKLARSRIPWLVGLTLALIALLLMAARLIIRRSQINLELERLVGLRTQELEAQKAAALEASKAKGDFLARMSHEIRTPMNAIIGMTELTLREKLPDEVYEMVNNIGQAGNSLLTIINDILDFSKIESGRLELLEEPYDLGELLTSVIEVVRPRLDNRPISFLVEVDSRIPGQIVGDESRLRQILINLLTNAAKYTREGHIALTVKAAFTDKTVNLSLAVSDTGIGLKPEDQERLFGDFNRFDESANKGVEGTGLGLAITLNLARLMGGDVLVESEYMKGSTFTVQVVQRMAPYRPLAFLDSPKWEVLAMENHPRKIKSLIATLESLAVRYTLVETLQELDNQLERPAFNCLLAPDSRREEILKILAAKSRVIHLIFLGENFQESHKSDSWSYLLWPVFCLPLAKALNKPDNHIKKASRQNSFTAPTAKILVVDDIELNLKVAKGLLKPFQAKVDTCENGLLAIDLVDHGDYDLIFMDHMMPGLDGLETTQRIRRLPSGREVPIIALTANAVQGVREMFIENGMNDFISKPIDPVKLEETLSLWLPREKMLSPNS
jgi:signal transduction histidine kinase/CheY-like chemotaxis protein